MDVLIPLARANGRGTIFGCGFVVVIFEIEFVRSDIVGTVLGAGRSCDTTAERGVGGKDVVDVGNGDDGNDGIWVNRCFDPLDTGALESVFVMLGSATVLLLPDEESACITRNRIILSEPIA